MIKQKTPKSTIEIDLTGPEGNAFYLMGLAKKISNKLGLDYKPIIKKMKSGNYEKLIKVFEENFGDFVTLYK
tara:strand:+ start:1322 stop:1537 length:216 start_codon:yes stop_codon:yes gene_type:complete